MAVLTDNTDVTISSPLDNQLLKYVGGQWVNWTPDYLSASIASGLYASISHTHSQYALSTNVYDKASVYTKTATYSKAEVDALIAGVPAGGGGGSTDADFLDGQDGTYYLAWSNFTGTPTTLAGYGILDAAAGNHNHSGVYADLTGDTFSGEVTFNDSVNFNTADAIFFENKKHAITWNDGTGNFNIRVGHVATDVERSTENGYAQHMEWSQSTGELQFNFSTTSLVVGNAITWTKVLSLLPDGSATVSGQINASGGDSSEWNAAYSWGDHSGLYLGITDAAVSADKLTTARTIDITGDITATAVAFDGTSNIAISAQVNNDSHTHDTQYLGLTAKAADSELLDGINSSSFLRSDVSDNITGNLEWQDTYEARFGNSSDLRVYHSGVDSYIINNTGTLFIRNDLNGGEISFEANNNSGTNYTAAEVTAGANVYFRAFHNGNEKIVTQSGGAKVTGQLLSDTFAITGTSNGYFYSDSAGRTAFRDGDFYIQSSVSTYYNYATVSYHGSTSGDAQKFRGNTLDGNNWDIAADGSGTFTGLSIESAGDAVLYIRGDTDNVTETDNAWIEWWQDGNTVNVGAGFNQSVLAANEWGIWNDSLLPVIKFGYNSVNVTFGGWVYCTDTSTSSDRRWKSDLSKIENALDKLDYIDGWTYNHSKHEQDRSAGIIAQDMKKALPEAVIERNGYLDVIPSAEIAFLVSCLKEMKVELLKVKNELKEVKNGKY